MAVYTTVKIPALIAYSSFPDRDQIIIKTEIQPEIYDTVQVYHILAHEHVMVQFPSYLFSYKQDTQTLKHKTKPYFEIQYDHTDLNWYITAEDEDISGFEFGRRLDKFRTYISQMNVVPSSILNWTILRDMDYPEWANYPHPSSIVVCHGCHDPHNILFPMPVGYVAQNKYLDKAYQTANGEFFYGYDIIPVKIDGRLGIHWLGYNA